MKQNLCGLGSELCALTHAKPVVGWYRRWGKRTLDLCLAVFLFFVFSPVIIAVGLTNSIIYRQKMFYVEERAGLGGNTFSMWKFRTMTNGDVTGFGKFLRYTALDELPQLVHVIRGEMSLVGPRPHSIAHYEEAKAKCRCYLERTTVRPGMTGLGQLRGHHDFDDEQRAKLVASDLEYIRRCGLGYDLYLLCRSALVFFTGH